ncbi:Ionotropic receptor 193 [Blattella germanica]|nr:Ionotropic receptor 193 [Blattella germanica]
MQLVSLLCVLVSIPLRVDSFSVEALTDVIISVQRKYTGCVFLVGSDILFDDQYHRIYRALSNAGLSTTLLLTRTLPSRVPRMEKKCNHNTPLYAILSEDDALDAVLTQLFSNGTVSDIRALIFLRKGDVTSFFEGLYIPPSSDILVAKKSDSVVEISEVYAVGVGRALKVNCVATWGPAASEIGWTREGFLERRQDLEGLTLDAGITSYGIGYERVSALKGGREIETLWYFAECWKSLEMHFNFTYLQTKLFYPTDGGIGSEDNGQWNGLVGLLKRHEIEVAVVPMSFTSSRAQVINVLTPVFLTKTIMSIRVPKSFDNPWDLIRAPFNTALWTAIALLLLILGAQLWTTLHMGRRHGNESAVQVYPFLYTFGLFCQNSEDVPFRSWASKCVYFSAIWFSLIIHVAYASMIIAFLTVHRTKLPFNSFEGLLRDGTYSLGLREKTASWDYFRTSEDPVMKSLYEKLLKPQEDPPKTYQEGYSRICSRENYGYMSPQLVTPQVTCNIIKVPGVSYTVQVAYAIRKGSPYRRLLNQGVVYMKQNGLINRILSKYYSHRKTHEEEGQWRSVSLENVQLFFVILLGGVCLSFVMLLLEKC